MSRREVGRVVPNAPPRLPDRQRLFHSPPARVPGGEVFFVTVCCARRNVSQLDDPSAFRVMIGAVENYIRAEHFWGHLFLAMPDHLHALLSFPREARMEKIVRDWKRFVARTTGIGWQDGFFDHRIRGNESFAEKAHYIRQNPVRGGLVTQAEDWPYVWPPRERPAAR